MVDVPERFLVDFVSEIPPAGVLSDLSKRVENIGLPGARLEFARDYTENLVKLTTWGVARWAKNLGLPASLQSDADAFFGEFDGFLAGVESSPDPLDVLAGTMGQFSGLANALGAFESVPVLGFVVSFASFVFDFALTLREQNLRDEIEGESWQYRKEDDVFWTNELIKKNAAPDWTPIFLPHNGAGQGVASYTTALDEDHKASRAVYVPQGPLKRPGLGVLPGTAENPRGWAVNLSTNARTRSVGVPWVSFKPSFQQAGLLQWQACLANSRRCYLVDGLELLAAWEEFWDWMRVWGWGERYSQKERERLRWLSLPTRVGFAEKKAIPEDYRYLVAEDPLNDNRLGYVYTYGSVVHYAVEDQLRRRQRKFLGTLTVAYVSEDDPAFRDPELAALLQERRQLLLQHQARWLVDMDQVVDADYKAALFKARLAVGGLELPTAVDPKGYAADAPLASSREFKLPAVAGPRPAAPAPILPGVEPMRREGGEGLVLFLLFIAGLTSSP